jgi:hypothetical protein
LTEAEKQITDETHELHVSLDEKQKKLSEYQTNIINIEKYASDLQTFLIFPRTTTSLQSL